jgi:hypothetical protein
LLTRVFSERARVFGLYARDGTAHQGGQRNYPTILCLKSRRRQVPRLSAGAHFWIFASRSGTACAALFTSSDTPRSAPASPRTGTASEYRPCPAPSEDKSAGTSSRDTFQTSPGSSGAASCSCKSLNEEGPRGTKLNGNVSGDDMWAGAGCPVSRFFCETWEFRLRPRHPPSPPCALQGFSRTGM